MPKNTIFEPKVSQILEVGKTVKVTKFSGKIASQYLRKPSKKGVIIKVDGDKALVRFKREPGRNCRIYYRHDHWIYLKDLRVIRKRGKEKRGRI